jgi:tRNA nucleotidyltransferase (CCA-adding enzyme)
MNNPLTALFETSLGAGGLAVLKRLNEAGYPSYFVGGCVRDTLLGRELKDIDIATAAAPWSVLELYPDAIPTGLAHGTVTVRSGDYMFEVTTFRTEAEYSDGRRPDAVEFIDNVEGDLARRDFTMNAMALSADGLLVDPYEGRVDLERRLLRCVRDPALRFGEDALRMLRCIRFASEYQLAIDPSTWGEVRAGAPGLSRIAMERVRMELERMISGADPYRALRLLAESELLRWTKMRLRLPRALGLTQRNDPLERLIQLADPLHRWALWFHRLGLSEEESDLLCSALRCSRPFAEQVRKLLLVHRTLSSTQPEYAEPSWKTTVIHAGKAAAAGWLDMAAILQGYEQYRWTADYIANGERWLQEMPVANLGELAVDGKAIIETVGRKGGPWLSHLLERLLIETALGRTPNDRETLLARAASMYSQSKEGGPMP